MAMINARNVGFKYPGRGAPILSLFYNHFFRKRKFVHGVSALTDVTLNLSDGDRVGLLGLNGSGKSTLLRLLSGAILPDEGEVSLEGSLYTFFGKGIGLDNSESGEANIFLYGTYLGMSRKEIQSRVSEIIEFTELGDAIYRPISTYSAGMRARLLFSLSIFVRADILLIDEGLGAGDAKFIAKARSLVESYLSHAKIVVLASHSEHLLRKFCNKGLILNAGSVHYYGDISDALIEYKQLT